MRIGMLRIAQETNALSPVLTEIADFERVHLLEGDALMAATARGGSEAPGFLDDAELTGFVRAAEKHDGVEIVPLFSAWTVPGGPLSADALTWFRERLARALTEAGPLDGVFVSLHGAMRGEGGTDPESVLLADLREAIGPDALIAATIDLHAHLNPAFMAPLDILGAYRTNPHRDHRKVGERTGDILIRALKGDSRPTMAWRTLPMVLGGGMTLDFLSPMRGIFRHMKRMERDPRVEYVSLCMCHLWSDAPDLGWATVVVTNDAPQLAERLADELADKAWSVRHQLPPELPGPHEAIAQARRARVRRRLGTICISDASDMVGAGAPGDNTRLLRAMLESGHGLTSYATLRDPVAIDAVWERHDEHVEVRLGTSLPTDVPVLQVRGRITHRSVSDNFGRRVVLDLDHVKVVLTEGPPLAMKPSYYRDVGLRPSRADIVMVKSLFPFRMYFALHNRKTIYAKTRGSTDFDAVTRQTFDGPVHPQAPVTGWRETDARRRA